MSPTKRIRKGHDPWALDEIDGTTRRTRPAQSSARTRRAQRKRRLEWPPWFRFRPGLLVSAGPTMPHARARTCERWLTHASDRHNAGRSAAAETGRRTNRVHLAKTMCAGAAKTCRCRLMRRTPACGARRHVWLAAVVDVRLHYIRDALVGPTARPGTRLPKFGGMRPPGIDEWCSAGLPDNNRRRRRSGRHVAAGGVGAVQPAGALVTSRNNRIAIAVPLTVSSGRAPTPIRRH